MLRALITLSVILLSMSSLIFAYFPLGWVTNLGVMTLDKAMQEAKAQYESERIEVIKLGQTTRLVVDLARPPGIAPMECPWWMIMLDFNTEGILVGVHDFPKCRGYLITRQQVLEAHPRLKLVRSPYDYRLYGYTELNAPQWLEVQFDENEAFVEQFVYRYGGWAEFQDRLKQHKQ